jgi:RNA polymerase sigma-70 factor, ECF subfamily
VADVELEEFRLLFERHHAFVYRFLFCLVGDGDAAQELTQETFFRAFKARETFRRESSASTWLCGIARNIARNSARSALRSRMRPVGAADETTTPATKRPDHELLTRELREALRHALSQLDTDKREAFIFKIVQGLSYEEIAIITGAAIGKLKTDVHRARLQMRGLLAPYLEHKR